MEGDFSRYKLDIYGLADGRLGLRVWFQRRTPDGIYELPVTHPDTFNSEREARTAGHAYADSLRV
jgi:hypothetical protein